MGSDLWAFGYVSRSCIPLEEREAEIARIVEAAVPWNESMQITGALVHTGEHFAQLVEGPEPAIADLRNMLETDHRHASLVRFEWGAVRARRFAGWALAYSGGSSFFARMLDRLHSQSPVGADSEGLVSMMRQFAANSVGQRSD